MREKRQHQRATFVVPVRIEQADVELSAQARDVSLGGISLVTSEDPAAVRALSLGSAVDLHLVLPTLGTVRLPGFVRWTRAGEIGIQFGLLGARETHEIGRIVRGSLPGIVTPD